MRAVSSRPVFSLGYTTPTVRVRFHFPDGRSSEVVVSISNKERGGEPGCVLLLTNWRPREKETCVTLASFPKNACQRTSIRLLQHRRMLRSRAHFLSTCPFVPPTSFYSKHLPETLSAAIVHLAQQRLLIENDRFSFFKQKKREKLSWRKMKEGRTTVVPVIYCIFFGRRDGDKKEQWSVVLVFWWRMKDDSLENSFGRRY